MVWRQSCSAASRRILPPQSPLPVEPHYQSCFSPLAPLRFCAQPRIAPLDLTKSDAKIHSSSTHPPSRRSAIIEQQGPRQWMRVCNTLFPARVYRCVQRFANIGSVLTIGVGSLSGTALGNWPLFPHLSRGASGQDFAKWQRVRPARGCYLCCPLHYHRRRLRLAASASAIDSRFTDSGLVLPPAAPLVARFGPPRRASGGLFLHPAPARNALPRSGE